MKSKYIVANEANIPSYVDLEAIWAEYAPYNTMPKFDEGFTDYLTSRFGDKGYKNVDAQAYDRGMEAGSRAMRASRWIEQSVGMN